MYNTLRTFASVVLLVFALPALADEVGRVTLENGATVKLNDDFTWEYVILESQTQDSTVTAVTLPATIAATSAAVATDASTVANTAPAVPTTLPANADNLTSNAIAQASLLKSTGKSGVKVSFFNEQWDDDGRLGLTFELSSNSTEHYVMIELEISLFADSGALIKKETVNVWQAVFRMPDSYLRKGQTRESRVFWIEGIDKAQWAKQLMSLKMKEMDSRM
ncbi:DUF3157 domain-containing protein [Shewanella sp. GutCb]|uniref:DUF3157 family protein n=1 Tax=Shewanella sp. GutCb TaxID=2058315 RepID=UPI000C7DF661|nr:DUF3157 family protein [Shewanella sp. GutCb]PKG74637.1 DUF3157 domain-containing protein [Shewanella sp. GutCb]